MDPAVVPRQVLGLFQKRADVRLQSVALTDDAHPDTVAMQRRKIVANEPSQQAEQVSDFGRGTRPVFRTEGENRQVENAKFVGRADDAAQCLDAAAMAFRARQTA